MSGFLLDKVIVQKCDQLKPWLAQVLESFPDLADVIEIVVESKAQHDESWAGQVDIQSICQFHCSYCIELKAPSKRALPLLAIVLAKQQVTTTMMAITAMMASMIYVMLDAEAG